MAEESRDKQIQGTNRSLTAGGAGGPGGAYQLNYSNPNYYAGIVRGTGADWFGPLNPMNPIAPVEVKGRTHDYPSGYNLQISPRSYSTISFDNLRNFAEYYDLLRLLIETRKDQMGRRRWNIVSRDKKLRKNVTDEMQARIESLETFFLRPDGVHFWHEWLRMLLEDLFVLDAPTLYKQRTYGGQLYRLVPIDGATIKRVIDDWGETPQAPSPAYQQVLKGFPAVDYTTDEMMYKPRNLRTHKVYGFSPVEQIIMTIQIGLRREIWQLQSFTEGNIPEALIGTPSTWTPDQIRSFQEWFDSLLEGQTAERRRARFVPGEIAKGYVPTKPTELFGEAEEWLIRVMCFAFSVSPQPFVKMMNRATSETAQEAAAEEGLAPLEQWVKSMMDELLIDEFGCADLEFEYLDEDELDPKVKSDIIVGEATKSLLTLNEARGEMGLDPIPDCPEADRPMVLLAAGWVPFALTEDEKAQKLEEAAQAHQQQLELTAAKGGGANDDDENGGSGNDAGGDAPPPADTASSAGVAKAGAIPFLAKAGSPEIGNCGCAHRALQKANGAGAHSHDLDPLRPSIAKLEKKFKTTLSAVLARLGRSVALQVQDYLESKVRKVMTPEQRAALQDRIAGSADWSDIDLEDLISGLDLSILEGFDEDAATYMGRAFIDAGKTAIGHLGGMVNIEDGVFDSLVDKVNDRAVDWAKENAGDLISIDGDDGLAETTRGMIRTSITEGMEANLSTFDIGDALEESYGFSEERAQLIAATEITSANSMGALAGYEESKDAGVDVKKSWLVMEDGCPICQENADAGAIDLDEEFPSGDMAPGAHPHCRCVLVPEVNDEEDDSGDLGADNETVEQADKPEFTKQYNDDQPRDDNGRFASDGGGSAEEKLGAGLNEKGKAEEGGRWAENPTAGSVPKSAREAIGNAYGSVADAYSSEQEIDPKDVTSSQKTVNVDKVQEFIDNPNKTADVAAGRTGNSVLMVKSGGKLYSVDGNHRVAAAHVTGDKIKATVVDMDKAYENAKPHMSEDKGVYLALQEGAGASKADKPAPNPSYPFPKTEGGIRTDAGADESISAPVDPAPASPRTTVLPNEEILAEATSFGRADQVTKLDNHNDMSQYFEVDLDGRGPIWAMGGNSEEAKEEREASLLQFVPFDECIATQDFCDRDKVKIYTDDPTAKGFAPMAYYDGLNYYIQDGHHRAVASKLAGNRGMSMNVKTIDPNTSS